MKLFDEKGKVFGKINIIDLLVILLIAAALVLVGVKVLGGPGDEADANPSVSEGAEAESVPAKLTYTVRVTGQRADVAERLKEYVDPAQGKKAQLQHGGKLLEDSYVVDFWTEPCRYNVIANGTVEIIGATEADAADLVNICFVVEAATEDNISSEIYGQEVRVGKSNTVKTQWFEFANGFVIDCEWEPVKG